MPIVYLGKKRDLASGDVSVIGISERVDGKDCIIFDDIINSGATAITSSEYLKKHGAKHIFLFATHGVLVGDAVGDLSSSDIDKIICTDTIAIPSEKKFDKLQIVSVAPILANAIMSS